VLATANSNNKAAVGAQAIKLKQILPESKKRFHEALDDLGTEIVCQIAHTHHRAHTDVLQYMAQRVMRRDLALARERAGIPKPVVKAPATPENKATRPLEAPGSEFAPAAKRMKLSPPEDEKPSQTVSQTIDIDAPASETKADSNSDKVVGVAQDVEEVSSPHGNAFTKHEQ